LVTLAIAAAGFAFGMRAGADEQSDRAAELAALIERAGTALVYSEFGGGTDTVIAANPADPDDRVALASITHAPNFGLKATVSPDGQYLSYSAATSPSRADLWLLDLTGGTALRLLTEVDLEEPVWSKDSDAVVVRRGGGSDEAPTSELLRVDLSGGVTSVASAAAGLYAIDFDADGALLYTSLDASGTDLNIAGSTGTKKIADLSDGIARDWNLSNDARSLAYLAPRAAGGLAATVVDVATGESGGVASGDDPSFNPIWAPDGSLTVGRLGRTLGEGGVAGSSSQGFDVPLSWSPNGAYLVVRNFEHASTADPGRSWLWVIDANGQRRKLSDFSDVAIAGWLQQSP
jgi:hypothetical protein